MLARIARFHESSHELHAPGARRPTGSEFEAWFLDWLTCAEARLGLAGEV